MFVFGIDLSEVANYNSSIQFATGDYKQMKGLSTLQLKLLEILERLVLTDSGIKNKELYIELIEQIKRLVT